jgi:hypothetical protein
MRFKTTKILTVLSLTLMLCMGVFNLSAYASDGGETLTVTAAWVDGELLRINVTDINGDKSALALRLSDYVNDAENKEYISIQAVDMAGNKSGIIEIKNPYYDPTTVTVAVTPAPTTPPDSQSAVGNGGNPFTPGGTGTVIDNAHDGDGKEFFTIGTEDGGVFYLIVDRQRNADNVYLLNSVTLEDLVALADKSGQTINTNPGGSTSAIVTPEQKEPPDTTENKPSATNTPDTTEKPTEKPPAKNDSNMYILIGIIVLAVGGAGYYFKIVKGKKNNAYDDDENEDESEDDYGYSDDPDDTDEETENGGDDE